MVEKAVVSYCRRRRRCCMLWWWWDFVGKWDIHIQNCIFFFVDFCWWWQWQLHFHFFFLWKSMQKHCAYQQCWAVEIYKTLILYILFVTGVLSAAEILTWGSRPFCCCHNGTGHDGNGYEYYMLRRRLLYIFSTLEFIISQFRHVAVGPGPGTQLFPCPIPRHKVD